MSERDVDAAVDPMIGVTIVGSYVIQSKLAEGGMGSVYVAVNNLDQKKVVKFLLPEYSRNEVIRERFRREALAAARLSGKRHIVKIDDVGSLPDGQQFMTMEFLHGRTLEAHLRSSGRVSPHHAFHIVVQIGRGLYELHKAGLVHRDLKPGNVFLITTEDNPYEVVLIDLGIAHDSIAPQKGAGLRTQTGMAMGTPGYMAVEQYGDAGSVTPAADLYALAIMLWEMVTGSLPWGLHDPRVLYHKQMTEVPEMPVGTVVPDAWRSVLLATLSPRVEARPPTVYTFLGALASALPADERLRVPAGAEIMARFAGNMIKHAPPDSETMRVPHRDRVDPLPWNPQRATEPVQSIAPDALLPSTPSPLEIATASERPIARGYPPSTTLSASSGVAMDQGGSRMRRSNAAIVAGFLVAGTLGAVLAVLYAHSSQSTAPPTSSAPGSSALAPASGGSAREPAPATQPTRTPTTRIDSPVDAGLDGASTSIDHRDATIPAPSANAPAPSTSGGAGAGRTVPHSKKPPDKKSLSKGSAFDPDAVEE